MTSFHIAKEKRGDIPIHRGSQWDVLPIGTSGQFLWVASGLPAWRTLAAGDLPAHGASEHSNRTRVIEIDIGTHMVRTGTPAWAIYGGNTRVEALAFDAVATEEIVTEFIIPSDYVSTPQIILEWTNLGAGAGTVIWETIAAGIADGGDLNATTNESNVNDTITAPALLIRMSSTTTCAPGGMAAGGYCRVIIGRLAGTLANDAGLLALKFSYTADS